MGRFISTFTILLARYHSTLFGIIYLTLVAFSVFIVDPFSNHGFSIGQIALLGFLLFFFSWRLALTSLSSPEVITDYFRFELALLVLSLTTIVLQASGGIDSPIFPVFYLFSGMTVAIVGFAPGMILTLLGFGVFFFNSLYRGQLAADWLHLLSVIGLSLVFSLTIGLYIKISRERTLRAQRTLYRLTSEARQLAMQRSTSLDAINRENVHREEIGTLLQIERVLGDLAEIAKRAMTAHTCMIAFIDNESSALYLRAISSEEKPPDDIIGSDLSATSLIAVIDQKHPLALEDLGRMPRGKRHRTWGAAPKALLAVPLVENEKVIGVIAADHPQPYHFGGEEERFMEMMARRVVESVDRERHLRHISAQRNEVAAFFDIIKKLVSSIDLETVSRIILESGQAILPYDFGILIHVDLDSGIGQIQAVAGLEPQKWLGTKFVLKDSLVGWVVGSKHYLHYPNLRERMGKSERRRPVLSHDLPLKNTESLLCLPLIRRNFVTDMLVFGIKEPEAFSAYDIKLFEVLAVQAAVSLENAYVHAHMEVMATTDGLTGCYNHRYFQEWLDMELARSRRMPIKISVVLVDIDHFKKVNDTYGHPVGDLILKNVSHILRTSVRQNDLAARYGGEEFALVLLDTDRKGAAQFAERVRKRVMASETNIPGGKLSVTVSMGVATYPDDAEDKSHLIGLADQALYAAKQGGRNQVEQANKLSLHVD